MSNKKQTAVEWLESEMLKPNLSMKDIFNQAKEMDKQQKIEAYNQGYRDCENDASNIPLSIGDIEEYSNAEQYYNDNYDTQKTSKGVNRLVSSIRP